MIITKECIGEFKAIYLKEYGEEISDKEARDRATRLISLYKAVYVDYREE